MFGICIVQLKPQLETLLRISYGALTKEVWLTRNLMLLFIDYQIPSDLLTYDGEGIYDDEEDNTATRRDKIDRVKENVAAVL